MNALDWFVNYLMGPLVLVTGLVGNMTAVVVFFKGKNIQKIGPVLIYKILFIYDIFYILQILFYILFEYEIYIINLSKLSCKLFYYFSYQGDSISPMLLVYISVEKYIAIAFPTKRSILARKTNQIIYFIGLFIYCSVYAIIIPYTYDLLEYNQTDSNGINSSYIFCGYINYEAQLTATLVDNINREIIPGLLMIVFSCLLLAVVFRSRSRVVSSTRNQKRLKRDLKLAMNCFFMNFVFILIMTPVSISQFFPDLSNLENLNKLTVYVFFICYGINFYVLLVCNSLFREELFRILGKKPSLKNVNKKYVAPAIRINNHLKKPDPLSKYTFYYYYYYLL